MAADTSLGYHEHRASAPSDVVRAGESADLGGPNVLPRGAVVVPPELAGEVLRALVAHVTNQARTDGVTASPAARRLLADLYAASRGPVADDGHHHDAPATIEVMGMVTVSQLAEQSGYSCRTLRRWAANGRITARRAGRTWLVDSQSLGGQP